MKYILEGFSLLAKPGLKRFVAVPLLINIVLFILMFFVLHHYIHIIHHMLVAHLPAWLHWLASIIWIIFFISFFVILIYTFFVVSNLIAAPFNNLLAEKVEFYLTGKLTQQRSLLENMHDLPRIVGRQFLVLGYYLPRAFLIFILFFLPPVQVIAPILSFLFHAWFIAMTFIDYPADNHRVSFSAMRLWMKQHKSLSLGFGTSALLITMVPFINFLAMPAAVAGAVKLWLDRENSLEIDNKK